MYEWRIGLLVVVACFPTGLLDCTVTHRVMHNKCSVYATIFFVCALTTVVCVFVIGVIPAQQHATASGTHKPGQYVR